MSATAFSGMGIVLTPEASRAVWHATSEPDDAARADKELLAVGCQLYWHGDMREPDSLLCCLLAASSVVKAESSFERPKELKPLLVKMMWWHALTAGAEVLSVDIDIDDVRHIIGVMT